MSQQHHLELTEIDYDTDQFLTLGTLHFDTEAECREYFGRYDDIGTSSAATREYKLDRFAGDARVDEKFVAPSIVSALMGANLTHLHDQADAEQRDYVATLLRTAE